MSCIQDTDPYKVKTRLSRFSLFFWGFYPPKKNLNKRIFEKPSLSYPGWKIPCNRAKKKNFSPGWKEDWQAWEDGNCQNNRGYQQIPAWVHFLISVSARAEIFHVIGTFFNPVCRAEIFPSNQPLNLAEEVWRATWCPKVLETQYVHLSLTLFPTGGVNMTPPYVF